MLSPYTAVHLMQYMRAMDFFLDFIKAAFSKPILSSSGFLKGNNVQLQFNSLTNQFQTSTTPSLLVHSGNTDLRLSYILLSHSLAPMKSKSN